MQNDNKNFFTSPAGMVVTILSVLCICSFIILAGGVWGFYYFNTYTTTIGEQNGIPTLAGIEPTSPTPLQITRVPAANIPTGTLETLRQAIVPENDPRDLSCRLEEKCDIPETLPSGPYKEGDKQSFWLSNTDNGVKFFQVQTTLQYVTEHAYFWVQDGVDYQQADAKKLMDTFENKIYPTDREFFGSEWSPGVDNDAHIYLVYARGIGFSALGYFSPADEYHPDSRKYSNAHEMFVLNSRLMTLNKSQIYGVLAHEFQHMIHWKQDRNESIWMNEGFSELAAHLNGYSVSGYTDSYISDTDLSLNDWPSGQGKDIPHYGASFLFLTYFLDRFGEEATQALVHDQLNGLESVDDVLKSIQATDKISGQPILTDNFFMDWATTNYLLDGNVGDGRYIYHNYPEATQPEDTQTISDCPALVSDTVNQYGVDYVHFMCNGTYTLRFEGATSTGLLPTDAYSGKQAFWSNKGDSSDMTLTREFDFSAANGPLTLKYHTWYDLEKEYDFVFLEASTDGGKHWQIIKTPSGTDKNLAGNSYGWGYNDKSNDWIEESVDLSQFKGQKVQIRFEYVTDGAVNWEGFLVDDISIPEINYATDFETGSDGWQGAGFVRVENILPQTFGLVLIDKNNNTSVRNIPLSADQTAEITMDLSDVTLVIAGTTRFTRENGHYSITVK
jgi:hypothetical protein